MLTVLRRALRGSYVGRAGQSQVEECWWVVAGEGEMYVEGVSTASFRGEVLGLHAIFAALAWLFRRKFACEVLRKVLS